MSEVNEFFSVIQNLKTDLFKIYTDDSNASSDKILYYPVSENILGQPSPQDTFEEAYDYLHNSKLNTLYDDVTAENIDIISNEIDVTQASTIHTSVRSAHKIEYLVFHYTASTTSNPGTAFNICNVFKTSRNASADYIVDDEKIVQYNPDPYNYYCWAVGDRGIDNNGGKYCGICKNSNSISIEICSNLHKGANHEIPNHNGWYFTDKTLANALKVGKILIAKYGFGPNQVIRHYDVTGKLCPGVPGWNPEPGSHDESQWLLFKHLLFS